MAHHTFDNLPPHYQMALDAQAKRLFEIHWISRGNVEASKSWDRIELEAKNGWRNVAIFTFNQMGEIRSATRQGREVQMVSLLDELSMDALGLWVKPDDGSVN